MVMQQSQDCESRSHSPPRLSRAMAEPRIQGLQWEPDPGGGGVLLGARNIARGMSSWSWSHLCFHMKEMRSFPRNASTGRVHRGGCPCKSPLPPSSFLLVLPLPMPAYKQEGRGAEGCGSLSPERSRARAVGSSAFVSLALHLFLYPHSLPLRLLSLTRQLVFPHLLILGPDMLLSLAQRAKQ